MDTQSNKSAPSAHPAPGNPVIRKEAEAFYQEALKDGPRLVQEVIQEGVQQGLSRRTQTRARKALKIESIPPATWQGPWLIVLPGDPAVAAAKQRREEKNRKKQHRRGNGRKQ